MDAKLRGCDLRHNFEPAAEVQHQPFRYGRLAGLFLKRHRHFESRPYPPAPATGCGIEPIGSPEMINSQGLAHAGLKAEDLATLSVFYETCVGLRIVERTDGCHIFDVGQNALFEIWSGGVSSPPLKTSEQQAVRICFSVERLRPSEFAFRLSALSLRLKRSL